MKKLLLLSLFIIVLASCTSAKISNPVSVDAGRKVDFVTFVAQNENLANGQKVADFTYKNNDGYDWRDYRSAMEDLAMKNGANLVVVKTIGWGIKGNIFYADGELQYTENQNAIAEAQIKEPCQIVVFRDGLESPLGSAFTIDVNINGTQFENLRGDTYVKAPIADCHSYPTVTINKDEHGVKLTGKPAYFKVGRQTAGGATGTGMAISIGGVALTPVDETLGRLMMYQGTENK